MLNYPEYCLSNMVQKIFLSHNDSDRPHFLKAGDKGSKCLVFRLVYLTIGLYQFKSCQVELVETGAILSQPVFDKLPMTHFPAAGFYLFVILLTNLFTT
jgi:hypothetical protein